MADFIQCLTSRLSGRGIKIADFFKSSNLVEKRVVKEYGAAFLNNEKAVLIPDRCIFATDKDVTAFQGRAKTKKETVGGRAIELQAAAMDALLLAEKKAGKITPKGTNPARRDFAAVRDSWNDTVKTSADYWKTTPNSKGQKLSEQEVKDLKALSGEAQVQKVLELEDQGFFFHPDHTRSIAVYTAIPGASQHLLMLALDINEYADKAVRDALAENGWFQTVFRDRPHFTYLGVKPGDLTSLGLKTEKFEGREFWIPNI